MPIEVDQSNKIERTERDTVLALSNDEQRAIVIPAHVKREAIQQLREQKSGKMINLHLFAAGLFILLCPYLQGLSESVQPIIVDIEYEGHEDKIKGMFLRYVHAAGFRLPKETLSFARVGKGSNAHRVAWQVQRGKRAPDHYVNLSELLATVE